MVSVRLRSTPPDASSAFRIQANVNCHWQAPTRARTSSRSHHLDLIVSRHETSWLRGRTVRGIPFFMMPSTQGSLLLPHPEWLQRLSCTGVFRVRKTRFRVPSRLPGCSRCAVPRERLSVPPQGAVGSLRPSQSKSKRFGSYAEWRAFGFFVSSHNGFVFPLFL